ncbi:MAG: hypothetical protein ACRDT4_12930 [Micromonosporaceae bacterium]
MRYAVVLTRVRPATPRDERRHPESVICRCEFDDPDTARRTALTWSATPPVRAGRERVKLLALDTAERGTPTATEWAGLPG